MIGIGAPWFTPTLLENAPGRIVNHLLGAASSTSVLPHRLLRQDWGDAAYSADRA
jgi:hypothetical protein